MPKESGINVGNLGVFFRKEEAFKGSLSEKIKNIINKIPNKNLTVSEIINLLGNDGLLLFSTFLTIIFLIPVSIPGFSTVFGGIIFFIGISNLFNKSLWLPNYIKNKKLPGEKLGFVLNNGLKWIYFLEKISISNRITFLIVSKFANKINNLSILFGSVLLMLPFGFIPFSNTLPALTILFISVGIIQKDGFIIILGYFSILLNIIYFGILLSTINIVFHQILKTIAL